MSRQPPKPTELIYLSPPTALPALFAAGIGGLIIGLYTWWPYAVVGGAVALFTLIAWLRRDRREIAAMPTEQHTDTAPIPLSGRQ
jgi:hypothetical protein